MRKAPRHRRAHPPATLDIRPAPEAGPDASRYEVDCRHGTTLLVLMPGRDNPLTPAQLVLMAVVKHELEERCGCVEPLYLRYGLPLYRAWGKPLPSLRSLGQAFDAQCAAAGVSSCPAALGGVPSKSG